MKIEVDDLEKSGYILIDKLEHKNLILFLNEKNKEKKNIVFYLYFFLLILPLPIISFCFTKEVLSDNITIIRGILHCMLGVIITLLFIPFHEFLHAFAYKVVGAKNISFYSNFKKLYFAVISDKSVLNVNEFRIVALLPFVFVILITLFIALKMDTYWLLTLLSFLTLHNLFCSGDFSLLNYMEINKERGIVTFDDKKNGITFFYEEVDEIRNQKFK